jgi:hypothetical protein
VIGDVQFEGSILSPITRKVCFPEVVIRGDVKFKNFYLSADLDLSSASISGYLEFNTVMAGHNIILPRNFNKNEPEVGVLKGVRCDNLRVFGKKLVEVTF